MFYSNMNPAEFLQVLKEDAKKIPQVKKKPKIKIPRRHSMAREEIVARNRKISKSLERVCARRSEEYSDKISRKKSVYFFGLEKPKTSATFKKRKAFLDAHLKQIVPRESTFCGVIKE